MLLDYVIVRWRIFSFGRVSVYVHYHTKERLLFINNRKVPPTAIPAIWRPTRDELRKELRRRIACALSGCVLPTDLTLCVATYVV